MNPDKLLWEKGDYTQIAALMRRSGHALVDSLIVKPPVRVLDLACGDGTTAIPLARLGAEVVGIDIASNLVEAARRRPAAAGLDRLTFEEGDASDLRGVADRSFDMTISVFGAMFAQRPFDVATEMVRVTRPGGRIVMCNWIPNDATSFPSRLLDTCASFLPPRPAALGNPLAWGMESHVLERFGRAGIPEDRISMVRDAYTFETPDKRPGEVVDLFRRFDGPTMSAFEEAERSGRAGELHDRLLALAESQNTAWDGGTSIIATFMRVTVAV